MAGSRAPVIHTNGSTTDPSAHQHSCLVTHDSEPSSPAPLATAIFNAFFHRNTKALLHAFSAHATPDAALDGRPLLPTLPGHPLAQMHVSREFGCSEQSRTNSRAEYTFTFDRAPLTPSRAAFSFTFTRDPHSDWRLSRIDTLDSG